MFDTSLASYIPNMKSVRDLQPRDYQQAIIDQIFHSKDPYGRIVSLETGLGKTLIAIYIILQKANINTNYTPKNDEISMKKSTSLFTKKIVFLVPTKNLVEQQTEYLSKNKTLKRSRFEVISIKNSKDIEKNNIFEDNDNPTIFIMIHKVALTLLRNGSLKIENIDVLVFDECHHTRTEHPYNLIMREFYFYGLDFDKPEEERYEDRPYILGLTASPIKTKIKDSSLLSFKFEMMDEMKEL